MPRSFITRSVQIGTCAAFFLLVGVTVARGAETSEVTTGSSAKPESRSCAAAFRSAQDRLQSGRFVEASQLFLKCASDGCSQSMAQECSRRNTELYSDLSSVVFLVTDRTGEPLTEIQVSMDGTTLTTRLDGLSLPVEAGPHEFSFSTSSGVFASQRLTIFRGQRNRAILVVQPATGKDATGDLMSASRT